MLRTPPPRAPTQSRAACASPNPYRGRPGANRRLPLAPPARASAFGGAFDACVSAGYLGFFLYFSLNWDMYRRARERPGPGLGDRGGGDPGGGRGGEDEICSGPDGADEGSETNIS
jgi:hypothetical protein